MAPLNQPADDTCSARVDETRVRKWSEQFEVFFHIPDHSNSVETRVDVMMPKRDVDNCWGIVPESMQTHSDGISFRLPKYKQGAIDVGCVMKGTFPGASAFKLAYRGPRCFADPPPPPANYAGCRDDSGKFATVAEWSGGMQGRVTLTDAMWAAGREIQLSFGPGSLLNDASVDRIYSAEAAAPMIAQGILPFQLHELGSRECGAVDDKGKPRLSTTHQCFDFH
eukprot:4163445-Prymnesium_polylepis.1